MKAVIKKTHFNEMVRVNAPTMEPRTIATSRSRQHCLQQLNLSNRISFSIKKFTELLINGNGWQSTRCCLTWKLTETKFNRLYLKLQISKLPATEITSGLLPTVVGADGTRGGEIVTSARKTRPSGQTYSASLADLARSGSLPTPTSRDWKGKQACEYKYERGESTKFMMSSLPGLVESKNGCIALKLNPLFVFELMGFPGTWTLNPFLKQSSTAKFPESNKKR